MEGIIFTGHFTKKARLLGAVDVRGALESCLMPCPFAYLADFLEADIDDGRLLLLLLLRVRLRPPLLVSATSSILVFRSLSS